MKCRWILATAVAGLFCLPATAQERVDFRPAATAENRIHVSTDQVETTPEMWLYQQERERYESPQAAIRRNAEYRAEQRQWRIAMMKAQGHSILRPTVSHTPMFGVYLPTQDPYRWGYGRGVMPVPMPRTAPYYR